ncbi:hypothetical protein [Neobacillus cucumis]|uniref:hypothetical protein n=1 Tax=Neobacillus cucumis TaxID=1740721 RepID=UPI0019622E43|nr:hypothetical protein [Neobacillus cucumis]MBM7653393.1 hypothetical protein [Neobacillus cucumis]
MSESPRHSDKNRFKRTGAVQNNTPFGQEKPKRAVGVSESPRHSDKNRSKRFEAVRIHPLFGQGKPKSSEDCPNLSPPLRQGKPKRAEGCPNLLVIRTRTVPKEPELSETTLYSDKESLKVQRIVRISPSFGQGPFQKIQSCPKPTLINTIQHHQTIYTDPTYQKIG